MVDNLMNRGISFDIRNCEKNNRDPNYWYRGGEDEDRRAQVGLRDS